MLSTSEIVALQLEKVAAMLPTIFPGRIATVIVRYRYSWEKAWREKTHEFWLALYPAAFMFHVGTSKADQNDREEVQRAAVRRLRRYHWKDRFGRVRRVKEIKTVIISMRRDPPENKKLVDMLPQHYRIPLQLGNNLT